MTFALPFRTDLLTLEFSTLADPFIVELKISECDTLALPFRVDWPSDESKTAAEPLTVLLSKVERPEILAFPFTIDPSSNLVGPETIAFPQMAESVETYTESLTEAVVATLPPPLV
jgi:hypothetical protein